MQRLFVALFASSLLVACGGDDSSKKDDMAAGSTDMAMTHNEGDMESPPTGPCTAGTSDCAAVATSIFNSDFTGMGTLDTVQLSTKKATTNVDATLDADTTLKVYNGELYVLMRDTGSVRIYDPATYKVKTELPTAATLGSTTSGATLPEDFYVDASGKIWVTLAGNPAAQAVGILDRTQPGVVTYVTGIPQATGDTDGKPEANKFYACGSNLWVTLQNYTVSPTFTVTYQKGTLAAINLTTKAVGTTVPLLYADPSDITAVAADCTDALVASSSSTTTSPDGTGGVERVNLTAGSTASVAADTTLGGRPVYVVNTSNYAFIAEYFDPEQDSSGDTFLASVKIIAYDLNAGSVHGDVTGKFGNINFLQLNGGNLYFGAGVFSATQDPTKLPAGLYITPADGTALTASPINLQLTPSAIALP